MNNQSHQQDSLAKETPERQTPTEDPPNSPQDKQAQTDSTAQSADGDKSVPTSDATTKKTPQLYTDLYFGKGHWLLKIWQTLVALLGWIGVFVPLVITALSYIGITFGHFKPVWNYSEGIFEVKFIAVLLLFLASIALIYSVSMTIIQVRKRDWLVEQWPTFNPIDQKKRENELDQFMDERFGPAEFRENVRNYRVEADQNLDTDTIQELFSQHHLKDL